MREGCVGHVVALPFSTFEKSGKRIAVAIAKPKAARPVAKRRDTPKISSIKKFNLCKKNFQN